METTVGFRGSGLGVRVYGFRILRAQAHVDHRP